MTLIPYVAGFLFHAGQVALIHKNRPDWQAGRWNAIGGKIEEGEYPDQAIAREFREETGYRSNAHEWRLFCKLEHPHRGGLVYFYASEWNSLGGEVKTQTDEEVTWMFVDRALSQPQGVLMSNLHWLLPLALSPSKEYAHVTDSSTL